MPHDHRGGSNGNGEGDVEVRMAENKEAQLNELMRGLYKKLYKTKDSENAKRIGAQFENIKRPEDAAIAYEIAFDHGAREREIILKIVQNHVAAGQSGQAEAFLERVETLSQNDKGKDIKSEWIADARRLVGIVQQATAKERRVKHISLEERETIASRVYVGATEEEVEGEPRENEPSMAEWIPAGEYEVRIQHFDVRKNIKAGKSERLYKGEPAPIGPLTLTALGTPYDKVREKARGIVGSVLKRSFDKPEPKGKIAIEIFDERTNKVLYSFAEEVDKDGRLTEAEPDEEITEEGIKAMLRSYGINPDKPAQEFIEKQRRALSHDLAPTLQKRIDGMNMAECQASLGRIKKTMLDQIARQDETRNISEKKPLDWIVPEFLTEFEKELLGRDFIERVLQFDRLGEYAERLPLAILRKEGGTYGDIGIGESLPFPSFEKYQKWREYLLELKEGTLELRRDLAYFFSPRRVRELVSARKQALEAVRQLEKAATARKKADAERFDEGKEKELLKILKTIGFSELTKTAGAEDFVAEKFLEFESETAPKLQEKIQQATTHETLARIIEGPKENLDTIEGIKAWYNKLRATVVELQNSMRVFKPGPDSPQEKIDTWNEVLSSLKDVLDAQSGEVETLCAKLSAQATARKDELVRQEQEAKAAQELKEKLEKWKAEIPGLSESAIARIWRTDEEWTRESIKKREYFSLNIALKEAEGVAFGLFAKINARLKLQVRDFEVSRNVILEFSKRFAMKNEISAEDAAQKLNALTDEVGAARLANLREFKYDHIKVDWVERAMQNGGSHIEKMLAGLQVQPESKEAEALLGFADFIEAARIFQLSFMPGKKAKEKLDAIAETSAPASVEKNTVSADRGSGPLGPDQLAYVVRRQKIRELAASAERAPAPAPESERDYEIVSPDIIATRLIEESVQGAKTLALVRELLADREKDCRRALKARGISDRKKAFLENKLLGFEHAFKILNNPKEVPAVLRGILDLVRTRREELGVEWHKINPSVQKEIIYLVNLEDANQRLSRDEVARLESLKAEYDLFRELDLLGKEVDYALPKLLNDAYREMKESVEQKHIRYAENIELPILLAALENPALKEKAIDYIEVKKFPKGGMWSEERKAALRELISGACSTLDFAVCSKFTMNFGLDSEAALTLFKLAGITIPKDKIEAVLPGTRREGKFHINTGDEDGVRTPLYDNKEVIKLLLAGKVPDPSKFPPEMRSVFADHHATDSTDDTSSAQNIYEMLAYLGFFKEDERKAIEGAIQLVTLEDNKSHLAWRDGNSAWWKSNWRRTMLGLASRLPFETIVAYAKDHPDTEFTEFLPDKEIKKYRIEGEVKTLEAKWKDAQAEWGNLNKDGRHVYRKEWRRASERFLITVPDSKFGKMKILLCRGGGFPAGIDAVKALYGDDTLYIVDQPTQKTFFASHTSQEIPDGLFGNDGKKLRKGMWVFRGKETEAHPFTIRATMARLGVSDDALAQNPHLMRVTRKEDRGAVDPEQAELDRKYDEREEIADLKAAVKAFFGEFIDGLKKYVAKGGIANVEETLRQHLGDRWFNLLNGDIDAWQPIFRGEKTPAYTPDPRAIAGFKEQFSTALYSDFVDRAEARGESREEVEEGLAGVFRSAWPEIRKLINRFESVA